jgi:hypothetical protein
VSAGTRTRDLSTPIEWECAEERLAAIAFCNDSHGLSSRRAAAVTSSGFRAPISAAERNADRATVVVEARVTPARSYTPRRRRL